MGYMEKVKRVTGRKEKVAKLVDKSTRFVDKCLSHKRAFADKPAGLPSQRLRYTSILEMIAGKAAIISAQVKTCLLRLSAQARQGKGARFWLCAAISVYFLVASVVWEVKNVIKNQNN